MYSCVGRIADLECISVWGAESRTKAVLASSGLVLFLLLLFSVTVAVTLWLFNIAMDNVPFIDDFPIETTI